MKKYIFLASVLSLCVALCSCAGTDESKTDAASTTSATAAITTDTITTTENTTSLLIQTTTSQTTSSWEDPENRRAKTPEVAVYLDGQLITTWNSMLYSHVGGVVADGYIMFMDPPYNEFPEYDLTESLLVMVDGAEKTTVAVRDAVTHAIIAKYSPEDLVKNIKNGFGAGRYIIAFDAKSYGTGSYANDCVVYSHYFYVNIK